MAEDGAPTLLSYETLKERLYDQEMAEVKGQLRKLREGLFLAPRPTGGGTHSAAPFVGRHPSGI